jgi:hypothetical protein
MWFRATIFALALAFQALAGEHGVAARPYADGTGQQFVHCDSAQENSRDDSSNRHRQHHNCLFCQGCCLGGFSPIATCFVDAELIGFRVASRLAYGFGRQAPPSSRVAQAHRARAPPGLC